MIRTSKQWMSSVGCLVGALALTACPGPNKAGAGETCAIDGDCEESLVCRNEVCVESGGSVDTDAGDADAGTDAGDEPVIEDEDYLISFVRFSDFGNVERNLFVADTSRPGSDPVKVNSDPLHCLTSCWLTEDAQTFVFLQDSVATPSTYDVFVAPVTDLKAGTAAKLLEGVDDVRLSGNLIAFSRTVDGQKSAFYRAVDGTQDVALGALGSENGTQGSAVVAPEANKAALLLPKLQTLDVSIGALDDSLGEIDYTFDGTNYQPVSGSFFISPNLPTAISKDGDLMALLVTSPNDYNSCQSISDCTGIGQHCGEQGRCTVLEVTAHFFDLNNLDNLGESCKLDSECGEVHTCDIPSATNISAATCIPRRVVLGLPDTPLQPRIDGTPKKGCEATAGQGARSYTAAAGPLSFDDRGNLYLVARRQDAQRNACPGAGETNIPQSDVLALDPRSGDVSVVTGNDGENFDPTTCFDSANNSVNTEDCVLSIKQAVLSPGGNEIAMRATNPNVSGVEKADETMDVWSVRLDGTKREWLGGSGIFDDVESVRVHPKP